MPKLAAALAYARQGLPVFPCGESKRPLSPRGFKDATCDEKQIRAWWGKWPNASIGMPTGKLITVLDLDVKKGKNGLAAVPNWETLSPLIAETSSGGRHVYFAGDVSIKCTADQIALGVDSRGEGGYVIVPPSKGYRWANGHDLVDIDKLPAWPDNLRPAQRASNESNEDLLADDLALLVYAVTQLPNDDIGWDDYNRVGMAIWAATNGSKEGFQAFDEFSQKSKKYDERETRQRWEHYSTSPPEKIGAGSIFYWADSANPKWRKEYESHHVANLTQSSAEFVSQFTPPDYLIDGLLQRRFIYSFTGMTGAGKTCIALRIALHVANGIPLDGREIERARVLFFAGENPDDVRMRWIKLCEEMNCDPANMNVRFLPGTPPIANETIRKKINEEAQEFGPFGLLIVDTSAAYFQGDDENSNTQLGNHARMLRTFVELPGGPTVLVTTHPVKNPNMENLLPRGGGAFLAEVDGNLVAIKDDTVVEMHWHGKFRGPDFNSIAFRLTAGTTEKLKDKKGRLIWTVTAAPISEADKATLDSSKRSNQDELLTLLKEQPGLSLAGMAEALGWTYKDGKPNKTMVNRALKALIQDKLVVKSRGQYTITKAGKNEADNIVPEFKGRREKVR